MINLLPPEEKDKIFSAKRRKLITIFLLFVLFFSFYCVLILLPVRFYIDGQVSSKEIILDVVKKDFERSGAKELQTKINSANLTLVELNNFYKSKVYYVRILEKISEALIEGTYLTNLSVTFFETEEETGFRISLSGFAPTRDNLFSFKNNLEKQKDFKNVYFPPSNWVKSNDIDFVVNFNLETNGTE